MQEQALMRRAACWLALLAGCGDGGGAAPPSPRGPEAGTDAPFPVDARPAVDSGRRPLDAPPEPSWDGGVPPPGLTLHDPGAPVRAADYDEAGNLWAAGDDTLYVKVAHESRFRSFT